MINPATENPSSAPNAGNRNARDNLTETAVGDDVDEPPIRGSRQGSDDTTARTDSGLDAEKPILKSSSQVDNTSPAGDNASDAIAPAATATFASSPTSSSSSVDLSAVTALGNQELLWHTMEVDEVIAALKSHADDGLTQEDAANRLRANGPNKLQSSGGISVWRVFLRQISNSLTLVLVFAMALSYGTTDYIEGGVINAVILLNIIIGFIQDYRAEKTMESLQSLSAPTAAVIRRDEPDSEPGAQKIRAEELVVGDLVIIKTGDTVPADLRLIEGMNLEADEALLTGESLPIPKSSTIVLPKKKHDTPLGDRINMLYSSSNITKGRGHGIVVKVGMNTEVGRIAALLEGKKDEGKSKRQIAWAKFKRGLNRTLGLEGTPLQVKLSKFALLLFGLAILLAIIVFSVAKWRITNEVLIYGICVAVAVIPESLIAVLTITMALGTKTMARGNVIVRQMQALEALSGVTNICSDKTGTLTQGKMIVKKAMIQGVGTIDIKDTSDPIDPHSGTATFKGDVINEKFAEEHEKVQTFLHAIALCNLAHVNIITKTPAASRTTSLRSSRSSSRSSSPTSNKPVGDFLTVPGQNNNGGPMNPALSSGSVQSVMEWHAVGEPTEISLQVLATRFGYGKPDLLEDDVTWQLLAEHPFDSAVKRMSVVYENTEKKTKEVFLKGAGEVVVPILDMPKKEKDELMATIENLAGEGLRVLCIAHRHLPDDVPADNRVGVEQKMSFIGLAGLYDPPRVETKDSVNKCKTAGITVHMLTGDHIRTATAIAHEVGILQPAMPSHLAKTMVMTASHFDGLTDKQIDDLPMLPLVIARCSPTTKVRMVEALHRRKAFCAMTGDGVNDSPALKRADVGIAMGLNGSDVAKAAADLVLTDDNFASIVVAVEEGRRLFSNIQKFLMHLLISNISQVVLLLIGLAFRDGDGYAVFPLSPLEILWVNMITSSFLAIGLGLEEAQPDVMLLPPHDLRMGAFTWEVITDKMIYGVTMGILCLASYVVVIFGGNGGDLGHECNKRYNESCRAVFEGRATVFAVLSFLLLLTAWEVKHFTRSLFNLDPTRHKGPFSVFHAVYYNRFLFWAVVAGFVMTFPVIYIPTVNTLVFKHLGLTWEWGVVAASCIIYLTVIESWKAIKRRFKILGGKQLIKIEDLEETPEGLKEKNRDLEKQ